MYDNIGMVFSMTNEIENKVIYMKRNSEGKLYDTKVYLTGGHGTGEESIDPLGSQGSIILSKCRRLLFLVNAGDNTISSFLIHNDKIVLRDVVSSNGVFPNSLAIKEDVLYVTNVGDQSTPSNVSAFYVSPCGCMEYIDGSVVSLSAYDSQPGNITVNICGSIVAVSEKKTNNISLYKIIYNGMLKGPTVNVSNGQVPFSAIFIKKDILLTTEASTNTLSSYLATRYCKLETISNSINNNQKEVCWISSIPSDRYVYTSNTGSGTISIYSVSINGILTYITSIQSVPFGGEAPIDSCVDINGQNLYVLNAKKGVISVFKIKDKGRELDLIQVYQNTYLPFTGSQGIAVI